MEWISVEERAPSGGDEDNDPLWDAMANKLDKIVCVLVTDGKSIEFGYYSGGEWQISFIDRWGHYASFEVEYCENFGPVTHWMEIPVPPLP